MRQECAAYLSVWAEHSRPREPDRAGELSVKTPKNPLICTDITIIIIREGCSKG